MAAMNPYEVYTASNSLLFKEENVFRYQAGGYHPVALGDILDGRYQICHKLGYGGFSTVWVARDLIHGRWVSVKIQTADATRHLTELNSLVALQHHSGSDSKSGGIVSLYDSFLIHGPNGRHHCLVFELLGPTVDVIWRDMFDAGERPENERLLKISEQFLRTLASIHEAGLAHGDLSMKNLAFASTRLSSLSERELFDTLGEPESEDLVRLDGQALGEGVPNQLVKSAEWIGWPTEDDDDEEDSIRIIDLGQAFSGSMASGDLPQPIGLKAPETVFSDVIDYRIDLWRAGLIIYYLTFGSYPFQYFTVEDLVNSMIYFIGDLPAKWRVEWSNDTTHAYNQEKGIGINRTFDTHIHEPEVQRLGVIVKGLMQFLPEDRMPASTALALLKDMDITSA